MDAQFEALSGRGTDSTCGATFSQELSYTALDSSRPAAVNSAPAEVGAFQVSLDLVVGIFVRFEIDSEGFSV